jgi:hypothetical protein
MTKYAKTLIGMAALAAGSLALYAEVPKGWFIAGTKPADYESSVDSGNAYGGQPSAYLRSKKPQADLNDFGTLMQNFSAEKYLGKRVRFSAFVKSENVSGWSGLWVRVDGKPGQCVAQLRSGSGRQGRRHRHLLRDSAGRPGHGVDEQRQVRGSPQRYCDHGQASGAGPYQSQFREVAFSC